MNHQCNMSFEGMSPLRRDSFEMAMSGNLYLCATSTIDHTQSGRNGGAILWGHGGTAVCSVQRLGRPSAGSAEVQGVAWLISGSVGQGWGVKMIVGRTRIWMQCVRWWRSSSFTVFCTPGMEKWNSWGWRLETFRSGSMCDFCI